MPSTDSSTAQPAEYGQPFNVDAWLEEAALPQRSVTVYGRGDLLAQLEDLVAQRDRHAKQPAPAAALNDPRLGGGDPGAGRVDVDALDDAIAHLRHLVDQSSLTLHVRAVLNTERQELTDKHTSKRRDDATGKDVEDFDGLAYEHELVSRACVTPQITPAQVARLHQKIGEAQWVAVGAALERASGETIDTPLSRLG